MDKHRIPEDQLNSKVKADAKTALNEIRKAQSDSIFKDCRNARFNKQAQVLLSRDTASFYGFPNKFKAWTDLEYYRTRLTVLAW